MVQVRDKKKARWLIAVHHESAEMEPNQRLHKMVRGGEVQPYFTLIGQCWHRETRKFAFDVISRVSRNLPSPAEEGKTDQSHPKRETHTPTCDDSQESHFMVSLRLTAPKPPSSFSLP